MFSGYAFHYVWKWQHANLPTLAPTLRGLPRGQSCGEEWAISQERNRVSNLYSPCTSIDVITSPPWELFYAYPDLLRETIHYDHYHCPRSTISVINTDPQSSLHYKWCSVSSLFSASTLIHREPSPPWTQTRHESSPRSRFSFQPLLQSSEWRDVFPSVRLYIPGLLYIFAYIT